MCVCAVLSLQVPALPASAGWLEQCGDGEGKRMTAAAEAEYTERETRGKGEANHTVGEETACWC